MFVDLSIRHSRAGLLLLLPESGGVGSSDTTYGNQEVLSTSNMQLSAHKSSIHAASQRSGPSRPQLAPAVGAAAGSRQRTTPQAVLANTASSSAAVRAQKQQLVPTRAQRSASRLITAAAGSADAEVLDTVVVGAGISGLVTAQALVTKHGDQVKSFLVTEGRDRVGGNITSLQGDGYVWEEGPNSFQPNDSMLQAAVSGQCGSHTCAAAAGAWCLLALCIAAVAWRLWGCCVGASLA